jgi:hypothetical protein
MRIIGETGGLLLFGSEPYQRFFCVECGGVVKFIWENRFPETVCTSCGLVLLTDEYFELRNNGHARKEYEDEHQKMREYLKWWLSSKKEKAQK